VLFVVIGGYGDGGHGRLRSMFERGGNGMWVVMGRFY
jgi:hypothetical protein